MCREGTGDRGIGTKVFVREHCMNLSSIIIALIPYSPFHTTVSSINFFLIL
jgi:hypothetical protein